MAKQKTVVQEMNRRIKKKRILDREWYSLRSLLGNDWAMLFFVLGGRGIGKSYSTTELFVKQWRKLHRPFYWLRLSETSCANLLRNNAEKLVDPDLRRKYNLELKTRGDAVYEVRYDKKGNVIYKKMMARVLCLATFYNDKGSGLFDKDFLNDPKMYYNICLDECSREKNEKRSFDIVYAFANQIENLIRSTKNRVRIICIANLLEEASDLLSCLEFIPEKYGRYYLKSKRAVVEYTEPSKKDDERRKGSVGQIMMPNASTFTNEIKVDTTLISKKRLTRPSYIIKFSKNESEWFTCWDGKVIAKYNKENVHVFAMRPYLDEIFMAEQVNNIIQMFDARAFDYRNLVTFKLFQKNIATIKPRGY